MLNQQKKKSLFPFYTKCTSKLALYYKKYTSHLQKGDLCLNVSFVSRKDEGDFKTTAEGLIK